MTAPVVVDPVINPDVLPAPVVYSEEDYKKLQTQLAEALKSQEEINAKLKTFEDKDKSEIDKAKSDAQAAQQAAEQAKNELNKARIQNKFLAANKYTWHNPERALALIDLSEVKIKDDGEVEGLEAAIDALAKSDPYLIKQDNKKEDKKEIKQTRPSGGQPQTGKGDDRASDIERIKKKFGSMGSAFKNRSDI